MRFYVMQGYRNKGQLGLLKKCSSIQDIDLMQSTWYVRSAGQVEGTVNKLSEAELPKFALDLSPVFTPLYVYTLVSYS